MDRHVRSRRVVATTLSASLIDFCEPLSKPIRSEIVIFSGPTTVFERKACLPLVHLTVENCVSPRSMYQFHSGSPSIPFSFAKTRFENNARINFYQIKFPSSKIFPHAKIESTNKQSGSSLSLSLSLLDVLMKRCQIKRKKLLHDNLPFEDIERFPPFRSPFFKISFPLPPNQPPSPLAWLKMTNYALDCAFFVPIGDDNEVTSSKKNAADLTWLGHQHWHPSCPG